MKTIKPFLSVVVPVYNESQRLSGLQTIYEYLSSQDYTSELIVVNDGSVDNTLSHLQRFQIDHQIQLVTYQHNRGKGYAIRQGMLVATGQYRLFADVDLSTPITEFENILPYLSQQVDIVIGTRKRPGATIIVDQGLLRKTLGKCFTLLTQIILDLPLSDFTCGFKCFSQHAAEVIFKQVKIERWGFDVELLFIAHKLGFAILEIPVIWINDGRSKVKLPHDIISSLADLLTVRWNNLTGKYKYLSSITILATISTNHDVDGLT